MKYSKPSEHMGVKIFENSYKW